VIELTAEQQRALHEQAAQALPMIDPTTQQAFILIRRELYDSLTEYDDGSWTDEETDLLAGEVDAMLDDDMAIEDSQE
jgi:hypothetical protein